MANTKKTNTENITEEVAEAVEVKTEETIETKTASAATPKKEVRKYAMDEVIPCRSVTYGELIVEGKKSKMTYSWANYGDVTPVEYGDLQALRSTRSNFLLRPRFVIEDPELVEQWTELKPLYDKLEEADVDDLFDLPIGRFRSRLEKAPAGIKQLVKNIASAKVMDGSLDSLAKIKAIDEILGTDLKVLIAK